MNNAIKISLTIQLEGSTLIRKSEPEIFTTQRKFQHKGKEVVKYIRRKHYPLVAKPASQHINLTEDAYDYMCNGECPSFIKPSVWSFMNPKQRLEAHLQRICENFKGTSYSYEVLKSI